MKGHENHFASAAQLIRKPINEVFQAFINPAITTKFWFTHSSGTLLKGESVKWTWEMFDHSVTIKILEVLLNEQIIIQWGEDPNATVTWGFQDLGTNKTFITITNRGFSGDQEALITQIRDATGGFTWVLAGLKAYLENGIELGLIQDRYPPELSAA